MDVKNSKNRRTDSIIITKEEYNNLLTMLKSGEQDFILATACINQMSLKDNLIPIALLIKHSNDKNYDLWFKNCPKHMKTLESKFFDLNNKGKQNFTYENIYKMILANKIKSKDHMSIFINDVAEFFKKTMIKFDFIEDVIINIKVKDYE